MIYDKQEISSELQMKIVESYKRLSNVWKVGDELRIKGQYVHKLLTKLGVVHKMNYFTDNDKQILCELYPKYRQERKLDKLASIMGRTKQFICWLAYYLGLTDRANIPKSSEEERARISEIRKTYYYHMNIREVIWVINTTRMQEIKYQNHLKEHGSTLIASLILNHSDKMFLTGCLSIEQME